MSLATSCVHCGTVFRVAEEQLKASEGWVRCGHCQQVFNALESLFDLKRGPASETSAASIETPKASSAATGFRYSDSFSGAFQAPAVVQASRTPDTLNGETAGSGLEPPPEAGPGGMPAVIDPHDPAWDETRPAAFSDLEVLRRRRETDAGFLSAPDEVAEAARVSAASAPGGGSGTRADEPIPTSAFLRRAGVDLSGVSADAAGGAAQGDEGPESVYVEDPREGAPTSFEPTLWTVGWIPPAALPEPPLPVPQPCIQTDPAPETVLNLPVSSPVPSDLAPESRFSDPRREPVFTQVPAAVPQAQPEEAVVDIPVTVMEPTDLQPDLYTVMADPVGLDPSRVETPVSHEPEVQRDDGPTGVSRFADGIRLDDVPEVSEEPVSGAPRPVALDDLPETPLAVSGFAPPIDPSTGEASIREEPKPTFVQQAERRARWGHPAVRGVLAGLVLAGLTTLGVQAAVHWRGALTDRMPSAAPMLDRLCASVFECPDASRAEHRLDALVVDSSNLAQPAEGGSYLLQLQIRNRSRRPVVAPHIDLTLTDLAGNVVLRRTLTASDLGQPPVLDPLADLPWQVRFSTPGFSVAGYTLAIYYP